MHDSSTIPMFAEIKTAYLAPQILAKEASQRNKALQQPANGEYGALNVFSRLSKRCYIADIMMTRAAFREFRSAFLKRLSICQYARGLREYVLAKNIILRRCFYLRYTPQEAANTKTEVLKVVQ